MARPKKIEGEPAEGVEETKADDGMEIPLKDCPKCGGQAGFVRDNLGYIRCHCLQCGYWDSLVFHDHKAAAESWNACGDPNAFEM